MVAAEKAVDPPSYIQKDIRTIDGVTWDCTPPLRSRACLIFSSLMSVMMTMTTGGRSESKERAAMLAVTSLYLVTGRSFSSSSR